jgi:hypothetical protein
MTVDYSKTNYPAPTHPYLVLTSPIFPSAKRLQDDWQQTTQAIQHPKTFLKNSRLPQKVFTQKAEHEFFEIKKLASAVGLFGVGMLLHQLPIRHPGDGFKTLLPADWKVWARVLIGIDVVHKLNQAFNLHLAPWQGALEAITIINPLAAGFSKNALKQTAVMAPLVACVVQAAHWTQNRIAKPLQLHWQIAPIITQAMITGILGLGAMFAYPHFYRMVASTGIIGKELKQKAISSATTLTDTFSTCPRGCTPSSFICLSELADISGSFIHWFRSQLQPTEQGIGASTAQKNVIKKV